MGFSSTLIQAVRRAHNNTRQKIGDADIVQWCEENCVLDGAFAVTGPFRCASSRFLEEPLRAFQSWDTKQIVILKATQTGGSLAAQLMLEWMLVNRPVSTMWVAQTNGEAETQQTTRIIPSLKNNKAIAPFLPTNPKLLRKDKLELTNVNFWIGGPSKERMQNKTLGCVFADELWLYEDKNVLQQLKKRVLFFENLGMAKTVIISQAGEEGKDLDRAWKNSTQEEWWVPCDNCKKYYYPEFDLLNCEGKKWNDKELKLKDSEGNYSWGKLQTLLTLQCPHCKHLHRDTPRLKKKWNNDGMYVVGNPNAVKGHRGFRWNSLHAHDWLDTVKEFIDAKRQLDNGYDEPITLFFQQRMAQAVNAWGFYVKGKTVRNETYSPKDPIPDEVARYLTVDVQPDSMFYVVRAWDKNGNSKQIDFGEALDIEDIVSKQKEHGLPSHFVTIDTGHRTREVYNWIVKYGFIGVKGVYNSTKRGFLKKVKKEDGTEVIHFHAWKKSEYGGDPSAGAMDKTRKAPRAPFYLFMVDTIKDILQRLRDGKGANWICLPKDTFGMDVYTKAMFSERKKRVFDNNGNDRLVWTRIKHEIKNDYWDCEVYQVGRALMNPYIDIGEVKSLPPSAFEDVTKKEDENQHNEEESLEA